MDSWQIWDLRLKYKWMYAENVYFQWNWSLFLSSFPNNKKYIYIFLQLNSHAEWDIHFKTYFKHIY